MRIKLPLHRKMMIFLIPAIFAVFAIAIGYIVFQTKNNSLDLTKQIANESAEKYAGIIKSKIESDFDVARSLSHVFNLYDIIEDNNRELFFDEILKKVFDKHPEYVAFWLSMELNAIDENFTNLSGRARFTFSRDEYNNVSYLTDTLDLVESEINSQGAYELMRKSKLETIIEPYYFSYVNQSEQLLETSVCVPLIKNNEFVGLVGSDLLLGHFQKLINDIDIYGGGYAFLLSNKGAIVAFPDESMIGKKFDEEYTDVDFKYSILKNIVAGNKFSYQGVDFLSGKESFVTCIPVKIGQTETPWAFIMSVPYDIINDSARSVFFRILLRTLLGLIVLSILIYILSKSITNPLKKATYIIDKLSRGEIGESEKLNINTGDEIEDISKSVNNLIDGLNRTAEFANTIGRGDLKADYEKSGENDELGNALFDMRKSLIVAEEEDAKRKIEDDKQNWATLGLAKFGDILRQHNIDVADLSFNIMSNLVDYVEAIQGGLFVKNTNDDDNVFFELTGAIAYDRKKTNESKFSMGESLIGRCAYEKLTIYMEEVPDDYVHVTSGLGESNPQSLLIVPAILNEEVYAIIELVSFSKFKPHQIEFVEKIGESIASTIANSRINQRTNKLLEQSKQQSEELAAQEEEMRQNLEELQATQEEMARKEGESMKLIEKMKIREEQLNKILDEIEIEEEEIRNRIEKIKEL